MSTQSYYFGHGTTRDFFRLICKDDEYGRQGSSRDVYPGELDKNVVFKFQREAGEFDNVIEHEVWNRVKDTSFARWFAPVRHISACGIVLVMARTKPVKRSELPVYVPAFFTDLKLENWGRYKGRIVCHDYAANLLMEHGMTSRMRKADWDD